MSLQETRRGPRLGVTSLATGAAAPQAFAVCTTRSPNVTSVSPETIAWAKEATARLCHPMPLAAGTTATSVGAIPRPVLQLDRMDLIPWAVRNPGVAPLAEFHDPATRSPITSGNS